MDLLQPAGGQNKVNLKKELGKYLAKWPWILLSIVLFFLAAKIYLRYTVPHYLSQSMVKIEGLKAESALAELQQMGTSGGTSGKGGASEEIPIILSRPVVYEVVRKHNLDVLIRKEGNIKDQELYRRSPVIIKVLALKDPEAFTSISYTMTFNGKNGFSMASGDEAAKSYRFDQISVAPFGTFMVSPKAGFTLDGPLEVVFLNATNVTEQLRAAVTIEQNVLNSAILELSHISERPYKSKDILNSLVAEYNEADLQNKRNQSKVSLDFIDERLEMLTRDLGVIENDKEGYKRQNQITDIEAQAQLSLQNANESTKALMDQAIQLEMINSVLAAAGRSSNDQLLPTNVGLPESVNSVITEYNNLVLTRTKTLRQASPSNPAITELNKEISSVRSLIRDNLRRTQQNLQLNINKFNNQLSASRQDISKFPTQEKIFRNIDRQQNLKESLYLFLLQKKEETSIANAVTMPKVRVVNPAFTFAGQVAPKKDEILLGSVLAGLLVPLLVFFVVFSLDTQVRSKSDITTGYPHIPILAEIPTIAKDESDLIHRNDLSVYAEAFRILTSNLKFMLNKPKEGAVVLFTSSVKGEGKTTVSINSALALASTKKVLLIGADLRNPQLGRYIDRKPVGLSDYLAQTDPQVYRQFIFPSMLHDNVEVMDSGAIPPNPTDLLEDEKLSIMLQALRREYDYVIIDTAPMMMVSDTFHILEKADVVVYVVRAGYTEKELLNYADSVSKDDNVEKMAFVLNDVRKNEMRYGYGGKYSYGYHAEKDQPFWKKLTGFKS